MTQEEITKMFENRWRMKGDSTLTMMHETLDGKLSLQELSVRIASLCRDFFEAGIALAEPITVTSSSKNAIEERAEAFCTSIGTTENIGKYGMPMLREFYDYWSEPNKSNTKMRFEMQKTWDLDRRLARWARNNFNKYGNNKPTPDEQQSKLASILVG